MYPKIPRGRIEPFGECEICSTPVYCDTDGTVIVADMDEKGRYLLCANLRCWYELCKIYTPQIIKHVRDDRKLRKELHKYIPLEQPSITDLIGYHAYEHFSRVFDVVEHGFEPEV